MYGITTFSASIYWSSYVTLTYDSIEAPILFFKSYASILAAFHIFSDILENISASI